MISPDMYEMYALPYEKIVIEEAHKKTRSNYWKTGARKKDKNQ